MQANDPFQQSPDAIRRGRDAAELHKAAVEGALRWQAERRARHDALLQSMIRQRTPDKETSG